MSTASHNNMQPRDGWFFAYDKWFELGKAVKTGRAGETDWFETVRTIIKEKRVLFNRTGYLGRSDGWLEKKVRQSQELRLHPAGVTLRFTHLSRVV